MSIVVFVINASKDTLMLKRMASVSDVEMVVNLMQQPRPANVKKIRLTFGITLPAFNVSILNSLISRT